MSFARRTRRQRSAAAVVVTAAAFGVAPAGAADTFTWTGKVEPTTADPATGAAHDWDATAPAGDTNWSLVSTNASGGTTAASANAVPAASTVTRLTFGPTAAATAGHVPNTAPNQDVSAAGFTLNAVTFADRPGAAAASYTLNGGPLSFTTDPATAAAPVLSLNTAVPQTINQSLILANTLTLNGSAAAGVVTINGGIRSATPSLATATGLTVTGGPTFVLNGSNSFTGGVTVNGGTLRIASAAGLPAAGVPLTMTGGTLDLSALPAGTPVRLGNISASAGAINLGGADLTVASSNGRSSANIGGAGGLTFATAGLLMLGGNNTYTGGTTLAAGALDPVNNYALGTAGTIRFAGGVLMYTTGYSPDYSPRFSTAPGQLIDIDPGVDSVTYAAGLNTVGGTVRINGSGGAITLPSPAATLTAANLVVAGQASLVTAGAPLTLTHAVQIGGYESPTVRPVGGTLSADTIDVGDNVGAGNLYPSGGAAVTANRITLGGASIANVGFGNRSGNGFMNLSGGATVNATNVLVVGDTAFGSLYVSNGVASGGAVHLAADSVTSTSQALVYVYSSGALNASTGGITMGVAGSSQTAALNVQGGGTVNSAGTLALNSSAATVTLSGGRVNVGDLSGVAGATLTLAVPNGGGPALTVGSDGRSATFAGIVAGRGTLAKVGTGTQAVSLPSRADSITLNVSGGTLALPPDASAAVNHVFLVATVAVTGTGSAAQLSPVAAGAARSLLFVPSVSLVNGGQLDVGNNDADLTAQGLAAAWALAATGFDGGRWDGPGLASSVAAADPDHLSAVGVAVNASLFNTFDGQYASKTDVLVRYTLYGDANLSGTVTAADYTRIDAGWVNGLTGWVNGDFNYDGTVDGSDYALMDNAFNHQGGGTAAVAARAAAVPEPSTVAGVVGLLAGRLARRRRHR